MKRMWTGIVLGIASLAVAGCSLNVNVGTRANFTTGLKVSWRGLAVDKADLIAADQVLSNNQIDLGSKVIIRLEGIKCFTLKDGRAFPGASMVLKGPQGDVLLDEKDLFANQPEGLEPGTDGKVVVSLKINTGEPMAKGETYAWTGRVWDKNGDGEITTSVSLKVR